jgi:hypothetical protein
MEDNLQWNTASTVWIRGKLEDNSEENSEEISSVALLSPACFNMAQENLGWEWWPHWSGEFSVSALEISLNSVRQGQSCVFWIGESIISNFSKMF